MSVRRQPTRRTVLRGAAGLALSLPWLEAFQPRGAAAREIAPPRRFVVWTQPNGTVMDSWAPIAGASAAEFQLSEILAPLERHRSDMIVVQNLMQRGAYGHQYVTSLTGYDYQDLGHPNLLAKGISLDQYLAQKQAGLTPIASLELGVCAAEAFAGAVSWSGAGDAVVAEASPFKVYARLLGGGGDPVADREHARRLLEQRRSVIDTVLDPLHRLQDGLGGADRAVVESYLESVRGIERELSALEAIGESCQLPAPGPDPSRPGEKPWWQSDRNAPAALELQRKLAVAALACDITRVVSLTLAGSSGGGRTFDQLEGVSPARDWHDISHEVEAGSTRALISVEKWHMQQLALLLDDLKAVTQPNGDTLLASTLVLSNNEYGSNGAVGYLPPDPTSGTRHNLTHEPKLMPYLLFGRAGGSLRTGRNLVLPFGGDSERERALGEGYSHTRLLVSILQALGYDDESFGDPRYAEGAVPGLVG